jgi:GNAT superfamily N-acetyltransferase
MPYVLQLSKDFATSFVIDEVSFRQCFMQLLATSEAYLGVAEQQQEIVGYLLAFDHDTFFANGRVAWIEEIMVRQDCRRQGIGRQLMSACEQWAALRGAKLIALATRRAAPFYDALGYEASATYFRRLL